MKEMMDVLNKLAVPIKLMVSLEMDGPIVNKSIIEKLNQVKRVKGFQLLVKCPPSCLIHVCHNNCQKRCVSIYGISSRRTHAEERICLKLKNL